MLCPYCGVEAKVSSARFCSACRTAFWDLTSPGECPPVPAQDAVAFQTPRSRTRLRNKIFLGAELCCIIGLAGALYIPAFRAAPITSQDYLNIHLAFLVLCSLFAWSNSKWSVIVSLGCGFAATIALNVGESTIRWIDGYPQSVITAPDRPSAANTGARPGLAEKTPATPPVPTPRVARHS